MHPSPAPTWTRLLVEEVTVSHWNVTVANPPLNLFDPELLDDLRSLADVIEQRTSLKVVVFGSDNPDYFMSHLDLLRWDDATPGTGAAALTGWPTLAARFMEVGVILIAKVRGRARGYGNEFVLACDMSFASLERALFGQPEVAMDVIPGGGALDWLPLVAGRSRALEVVLSSNDFDAASAERYGWINRALPDDELDEYVDRLARRLASFDKQTLSRAKTAINRRADTPSPSARQESLSLSLAAAARSAASGRAAIQRAFERGMQKPGDFELNLGRHLGELDAD